MAKLSCLALASLLVLSTLNGCGGDTHDSVAEDTISTMKEMFGILEGVKDKATAEAAKPQLEAFTSRIADLKKRMDAIGEPDAATQKRLGEKMQAEMASQMGTMMKVMMNPEVQAVLKDTMSKLEFK